MRTMPVATSIVMNVVSFACGRAVSLRAGALKHTSIEWVLKSGQSGTPHPERARGVTVGCAFARLIGSPAKAIAHGGRYESVPSPLCADEARGRSFRPDAPRSLGRDRGRPR